MCLIAYRESPGAHVPVDVIDHNLRYNPDGFGLAWRDPEAGLLYEKFGPKDSQEFRDLVMKIDSTEMIYAAHWRTATAGSLTVDMAHPFEYVDEVGNFVLAFHNGVIDIKHEPDESDTYAFVERVLARLKPQWWKDNALRFLVESSIGWSRFLLMDEQRTVLLNERDWKQQEGIMYSTHPKGMGGATYSYGMTSSGMYQSYPTTQAKSAQESANILLPEEEEDRTVDVGGDLLLLPEYVTTWNHAGHRVTPIYPADSTREDDEAYGTILCLDCGEEGDFYIIEGQRFLDIAHAYGTEIMH